MFYLLLLVLLVYVLFLNIHPLICYYVHFSICTVLKDTLNFLEYKSLLRDFPAGAVVKNPPANAGDTGSRPGPGRSHMPWSN